MNIIKRLFLCIALLLSLSGVVIKHIIDSTKMAVVYSPMPIACVFLIVALILLITYTFTKSNISKNIFLFAVLFLVIKECLWAGNTISVIFYITLIISRFKTIKQKTINIAIVVDSLVTSALTIWFIIDNINYYGSFYYASPYIIGLLASLCANIEVWLIAFKPISK